MSPSWIHRAATVADLPAIAALDADSFGNPWSLEVYRQELVRPFARLWVAEADGRLEGSSCIWILGDEAHLLRIATDAQRRRRGLGRAMLGRILAHASATGCRRILLEVAAGNAPAVHLYEAAGFVQIGRRERYYAAPPDDALVMERTFVPGEGHASGFAGWS
ncbi:MAG: ribosomal protein S18-alanine N-acetyltransferase [Myxococcota bacterium]